MPKATRRQFCERTLKFYFKEDTGQRNYSQHDEHLQKLVEAEQQVGTKKEREPMEVRYLKLMFKTKNVKKGKGKRAKTVKVDDYPNHLQQVVREFPLILANIHLNPNEELSLEQKTLDALHVLHEEVVYLLSTSGKSAEASELTDRFCQLTWKTFKTTARGTKTKEEKISSFLQGFDFGN